MRYFIQLIQPYLTPICAVLAWGTAFLAIWSIWRMIAESTAIARRMHQIPCARCRFFSEDRHLKCSVHPAIALTEEAIGCRDYTFIPDFVRHSRQW